MDRVIAFARSATNDKALTDAANRVDAARQRIEAFTGYFNEAMASRNLRNRTTVSLKRAVLDFSEGVRPILDRQSVTLNTITPPVEPLFTVPLHEAELSSILLNLLTN